jgi:hypothetical protein
MFEIIKLVADKLEAWIEKYIKSKSTKNEALLGTDILELIIAIQDICFNGYLIFNLIESLISNSKDEESETTLKAILSEQLLKINDINLKLKDLREKISLSDTSFYLDFMVLIDEKRGIISSWLKYANNSPYSSSSIFFLSEGELLGYEENYLNPDPQKNILKRREYELRSEDISDITNLDENGKNKLIQVYERRNPKENLMKIKESLNRISNILKGFDIKEIMKKLDE